MKKILVALVAILLITATVSVASAAMIRTWVIRNETGETLLYLSRGTPGGKSEPVYGGRFLPGESLISEDGDMGLLPSKLTLFANTMDTDVGDYPWIWKGIRLQERATIVLYANGKWQIQ